MIFKMKRPIVSDHFYTSFTFANEPLTIDIHLVGTLWSNKVKLLEIIKNK
jgi:hypothetical protein